MNKNFWKDLADRWPIVALAPMDGYTDSPYRQVVKSIAPDVIAFSEFYSADGLVHSKTLWSQVLPHADIEKPLIIQIFGKDPEMFRQAAILIESYGVAGIDVNMGCPAKKVVKSGHGSSLMINTDTAFKIIEEMSKAVKIPISVKTRLGWENWENLIDFCKGLENAGANLITVHGRTYKQAFTWQADFTGIYELKKHLNIPVIANGDVMSYDDGISKIDPPVIARSETTWQSREDDFLSNHSVLGENRDPESSSGWQGLDWFMIGRASFGNPWCFLPGKVTPTLAEVIDTMELHARLLVENKGEKKWCMEIRKHLVQYLHSFPGVKEYRKRLVMVESLDIVRWVLDDIRKEHKNELLRKFVRDLKQEFGDTWGENAC